MRTTGFILALFATAVLVQACETPILNNEVESQQKKLQNNFKVGEEFVLNFDSEVKNETHDISVKFISVDEYRCPKEVMCVWAGNAEIEISVIIGQNYKKISLNTHRNYPKSVAIQDYQVQLISLDPYPESSENPVSKNKYKATLIIEYAGS